MGFPNQRAPTSLTGSHVSGYAPQRKGTTPTQAQVTRRTPVASPSDSLTDVSPDNLLTCSNCSRATGPTLKTVEVRRVERFNVAIIADPEIIT